MSLSKSKPEIRRTVVEPAGERIAVEIHIADAAHRDETPETQIVLAMKVTAYSKASFAHLQLNAVNDAIQILEGFREELKAS